MTLLFILAVIFPIQGIMGAVYGKNDVEFFLFLKFK